MPTNGSALFVLVRESTPDTVLPELGKFGGTILRTSLSHDAEEQLRNALGVGDAQTTTPAGV